MNEPLIWILAGVVTVGIVAFLLWLGRQRQQRARDASAHREAQRAALEQAEHVARARQLAEQQAAAAALEAERARAEREEAARREAEAQAAREAEAEQARRLAEERAQAERLDAERVARETAARELQERQAAERERAEREDAERRARELAAREAEAAAEQRAAEAAAAAPTRELRTDETLVLVADDSKIVRVKISRLLSGQGYRVALAESGEQALELLAAERPHLIVTDVEMPGIDGFELTRRVRAGAATAGLPVVMITSSDDKQAEAQAAGVTQLLGKPYSEEALIAAIETARLAVRVPA